MVMKLPTINLFSEGWQTYIQCLDYSDPSVSQPHCIWRCKIWSWITGFSTQVGITYQYFISYALAKEVQSANKTLNNKCGSQTISVDY